jgi:hypothetical protein
MNWLKFYFQVQNSTKLNFPTFIYPISQEFLNK